MGAGDLSHSPLWTTALSPPPPPRRWRSSLEFLTVLLLLPRKHSGPCLPAWRGPPCRIIPAFRARRPLNRFGLRFGASKYRIQIPSAGIVCNGAKTGQGWRGEKRSGPSSEDQPGNRFKVNSFGLIDKTKRKAQTFRSQWTRTRSGMRKIIKHT